MSDRDAAEFNEASYVDDPAEQIDSLQDHIRELVAAECPSLKGRELERFCKLVARVVSRLLTESRLGPQIELRRLTGRELLSCLIGEIIEAPEPRLMARCIDFVFVLGVQLGLSETDFARIEGVTKASASRYCVHLKDTYLSGRPAPGMKSAKAVDSYRALRSGRSSRAPRQDWAFMSTFKNAYAAAAG